MKKKLFIILLFFTMIFTSAIAEDKSKAVIIFDASGSMWGQINGKAKIEIARDALKNVIREWNPNVELGLTAYGHRSKGDCNDIETVIPVGKVDKNRVIRTVMGIQPKGKTPISRSLRKVANEIRYTEEKATIILISDGKETCDPDPCGTAKELEKQGIDFVTHVIGFNVDKNTDKQLECIAHATGGEYFSAKNAVALNKAIKVIAKKVEKPKPVLTQTTLELIVRYTMSPKALNVSGMYWEVMQNGIPLYSGKDEAPKISAKVGNVYIKASYNRTSEVQKVEGNVTLKATKNNPVVIQLKSGKVMIDAAEERGGPKVKAAIHIYPVLNDKPNMNDEIAWCVPTKTKICERVLPIGEFLIQASYNNMKKEKRFVLTNKEKKVLHIFFKSTGKVEVTASEKEGGKWVDASCIAYKVIDGEVDDSDYWSIYALSKKKAGYRQLPVGKYQLKCKYNEFKKEVPFELKAGEVTKVHVVFEQFRIKTKCSDMHTKVSYEVYANSGRMVYDTVKQCSEVLQLTLDRGDYTIEASIGNDKKEEKFTIGGDTSELTIDMSNINKEPTKEELIQADTQKVPSATKQESKQVHKKNIEKDPKEALEALGKMFGGLSQQVGEKDAKEMEKAGEFLKALGGLMGGTETKEHKAIKRQKETAQKIQNEKADKEFDEMSQELDMFTK